MLIKKREYIQKTVMRGGWENRSFYPDPIESELGEQIMSLINLSVISTFYNNFYIDISSL